MRFSNRINAKRVDAAVKRGEEIILISKPKELTRIAFVNGKKTKVLTGYGKEVHRLEWKHGLRYDPATHKMLPAPQNPGLKTLTKFESYKIID